MHTPSNRILLLFSLLFLLSASSMYEDFSNLSVAPGDTCATITSTQINGTVYEDWNYNGTMDELTIDGIANVTVNVYDCFNTHIGTSTTDIDGNYSISSLTAGEEYRVEFVLPTALSSWAKVTHIGSDNGGLVQMVDAGNCASLGLADPSDYCPGNNPDLVISCFEKGNAVYGATGNENAAIINLEYNSSGPTPAGISSIASIYEVGTVWGMAWQASNKRSFHQAFLKRHTGLGPLGLGGVYVLDYNAAAGSLHTSFDLQGVTPSNGGANIDLGSVIRTGGADYVLADNTIDDSHDIDAFGKIGKIGYGDSEIGPDGNTLWMINNNQQALISVDVSDPNSYPGTVNQYPLSGMSGAPTCTNGELRPWGLSFYQGKGYLGCVCTGENSGTIADVHSYVLSFDPTNPTTLTNEVDFPMDYVREKAVIFPTLGLDQDGDWHPWANNWTDTGFSNNPPIEIAHAQPMITDIEFADDGSMILGLADRFGFQMGYRDYIPVSGDISETSVDAAGDIIKVCNIGGSWVLEGGTGCGVNDSATNSALANDGPSGMGEFFYQDYFDDTGRTPQWNHNETFIGSLSILKGTNEVVAAHYDPVDGNGFSFDLGLLWHDVNTGARSDEFRVIEAGPAASKGNNLGDLETVCGPAPLEIGNYVWCDSILNGVQDACERPINDVSVKLYDRNGILVGLDQTIDGHYYFDQNNVDTTGITIDGGGAAIPNTAFTGLSYSTEYFIVFGDGQFATDQFTIGAENLGITPLVNHAAHDEIDSDVDHTSLTAGSLGARPDGLPFVSFTTDEIGSGDHKFDMGLTCVAYDFGDLNDLVAGTGAGNYETNLIDNGPFHQIVPGLSIGSTVDGELINVNPNAGATGDGADEDGFSFPSNLDITPGGTITLPIDVTNTTGTTAHLEIWIDWNGDGDFDDAGEMIANLSDNGSADFGSSSIVVNVPNGVATGQDLGFRARLSHEDDMTPNGQAFSGEVEDYIIQASCKTNICLPITIVKN